MGSDEDFPKRRGFFRVSEVKKCQKKPLNGENRGKPPPFRKIAQISSNLGQIDLRRRKTSKKGVSEAQKGGLRGGLLKGF